MNDLHIHTNCSPDADKAAAHEAVCVRAEQLGLAHIAITDHCDCNFWLPEGEGDYPEWRLCDREMFGARDYAKQSIERTARLKERYPFLLCGVELGQPLQAPQAAEEIAAMPQLDFIIGSLHMNAGKNDFYWLDYGKMSAQEIHKLLYDYFSELLDMAWQADFDTLAHLTYPLRYICGRSGIAVDIEEYFGVISEIFRALAKRGKALEINTSGLYNGFGKNMPDEPLIRLYRDMGGELVTFGSDAHAAANIGAGIAEGMEHAKSCGIRYSAYFIKRDPQGDRL